jgi:hypothetical protein
VEGNTQFVLMEDAWPRPDKPLPADTFEIFFSFGAAYALSADTFAARAIRGQVDHSTKVYFVDPAKPKEKIDATNSWTAFCVKMQYYFELTTDTNGTRLTAFERLHQQVPISKLSSL